MLRTGMAETEGRSSYLDEDAGRLGDGAERGDGGPRALSPPSPARPRRVLGPLVAEPGKPLPPAANLSMNGAVTLRNGNGSRRFGAVEFPPVVPRFVQLRPRP